MINVLQQLNIDFKYQKQFKWSNKKRYDFYIPSFNMIIETHGIQHYKKLFTYKWGLLKDIKENDKIKKQLAKQNNIKYYIVIDCSYSNLYFIKNSIINSRLIKLLNFKEEEIDWIKCHENAISNKIKMACELWNNKFKNTTKIGNELKVDRATIVRYLKQGAELGWCDYSSEESSINTRKITAENNSKKVICLNTNEIFSNIKSAGKHYNIQRAGISRCCSKETKHCGEHQKTNEPLYWMYYEDYKKMTENQIQEYVNKCRSKWVVCMNDNKIFYYTADAEREYDVGHCEIVRCCKGLQKFAGKHFRTNEKLHWMFYEDYLVMQQNNQIEIK
jgi:hypothetical protein